MKFRSNRCTLIKLECRLKLQITGMRFCCYNSTGWLIIKFSLSETYSVHLSSTVRCFECKSNLCITIFYAFVFRQTSARLSDVKNNLCLLTYVFHTT